MSKEIGTSFFFCRECIEESKRKILHHRVMEQLEQDHNARENRKALQDLVDAHEILMHQIREFTSLNSALKKAKGK